MKRVKSLKPFVLIALIALSLLAVACSPSAEKLNNEGNEKFAEEAYMEALATYQEALIESPELAEPYYNAANALYREGAFPEALALMEQALSFAEEESLAESGLYNKGNSSFNTQEWEEAIAAYSNSLLLNPEDQDAKYNLELALQQMQQQEQEQEQEQEQDGEGQEEEQQDQQEQSENGEQDQEQNQEEQQDQPQDGEGQEDDQQPDQSQPEQGQPQDGENQEQQQPSQMPQPGQRMTAEQAKQLLAAIAEDSETLQEKLGQMFVVPPIPPVQDW
jgi:tetratricopeptide (TPR) repeat protein